MDFNDWYKPDRDPELDISDADRALDSFFQACFEAGPERCALWSDSPEGVRDHFLEADRQILEEPLPVPAYGLIKAPLWRSGVYNALYRPAEGFPLLAGVAAEILNGTAGPAIQMYLDFVRNADSPFEAPLIDPVTGLKNSPIAGQVIFCSDSGAHRGSLRQDELEAIYGKYLAVSQLFAPVAFQYNLICLGMCRTYLSDRA